MFNPQASLSSRRETLFTPKASSSTPPRGNSDMDQFDRQFEESTENSSMLAVPGYAESHTSWSSRLPSLSPSSRSAAPLHSPHLSPPSSASPSSTFSANLADDFLLNNSFNTADLDMFFQQQDVDMSSMLNDDGEIAAKAGHTLSIPNFSFSPSKPAFDFSFGNGGGVSHQTFQMSSMGYQQPGKLEDNYDLSSFVDIPSTPTHADTRRFSVTSLDGLYTSNSNQPFQQSQQHYPVPTDWGSGSSLNAWTLEQARRSLSAASSAQASQSLTLDDLSSQIAATSGYSPQSNSSWRGLSPPALQQVPSPDVGHLDAQIKALEAAKIQVQARLAVNAASYGTAPQSLQTSPAMPAAEPTRKVAPVPPRLVAPLPTKRALLPSTSKPAIPAPRGGAAPRRNAPKTAGEGAPVGKHNKTEKRYRQKVQAAQTDLRDAVPALRVLYGTSSDEQLMTTDIRADDGTVDGLGEVTRPNASAKATVLVGARMYIELLQRRVAKLERRVGELEEYRRDVGGEPAFIEWNQSIFDRESVIEEALRQAEAEKQAAEAEQGDSDDDEEESDQAQKGAKRARTTAAPKKAKPVKKEPKGKGGKNGEDPNFGPEGPAGSSGGGVRVFAAFAMSFSLIPSASTLFRHSTDFSSSPSKGHVISRLPLVTAEHSSRILAKALPGTLAPHADSLLDWGWRLIVAIVLGVLIGPVVERWWFGSALSTMPDDEVEKLEGQQLNAALDLGSARGIATEAAKLCASRCGLPVMGSRASVEGLWTRASSAALCQPLATSTMARLHLALRLSRTATSPMSLALLSLLQPRLPIIEPAEANWKAARMSTTDNTSVALRGLLDLPLHEAQHIIADIQPSSAPLAAMANHVTLLHLNDMFSRFFIALVNSSTSQLKRPSITAMLSNVDKRGLSAQLPPASFKDEMRALLASVPHGSSARALGLVLTGLWSIFNQSAPEAQAALASSLAAEQLQGAGVQLKSVSALLQLLWPGSSTSSLGNGIDDALVKVDALARQTDDLASVCVELVQLLGSSGTLPDANATRAERLEASKRVMDATLSLRAMLAQPAFERVTGEFSNEEADGPADGEASDTASESGSSVALQLETVAFAEATERLIEVLTAVGRRAAGRRDGRDQDSGLEGDVDEL